MEKAWCPPARQQAMFFGDFGNMMNAAGSD